MNPAFSVIFLTVMIGAGQGLFFALYLAELLAWQGKVAQAPGWFYAMGAVIGLALMGGGLLASFLHLGRPERAWRAAAMWRTSWLSREVILLPLTMLCLAVYGLLHYLQAPAAPWPTLWVGAAGSLLSLLLYLCTAMIYACIRFLQEWASSLTVVNYLLIGSASGYALASAVAAVAGLDLSGLFAVVALFTTLAAAATRIASLVRNRRLRPRSSPQTAIGVRHKLVTQKAQGFMGGSFNTREFFHGKTPSRLKSVKWIFLALGFFAPSALLAIAILGSAPSLAIPAFLVQFIGLLFERWYFFADANHPQNLYYQAIS